MSLSQSRSDKNESQFRKPGGRTGSSSGGQQRIFTGGRGRGGGGPASPTTSAPTISANRSYKKANNAQIGQLKGSHSPSNLSNCNTVSGASSVENGGRVQPPFHGPSNAPAPEAITKLADASFQKSSRPLPRAPSSQSSSLSSDSTLPSTPMKGDGGKGFSLQFGSISPGFMNKIQVPARTSSAPPNLDEQKRDQARFDASRAVPPLPLPSASNPELPKKHAAPSWQPSTQEFHAESKTKRNVQVASVSPPTQPHKPSALPMAGMSMPLPFHQPTVSMPFGGPNPQIQSQGMTVSSFQVPMQMPLQMGNPSQVPQQVFLPGLQHHLMQTQGIMHQGQNLGFNPQMGTQLPHQLGNLGMNIPTQFNQQQGAKFGSTRKAVKITHPDTHEELRLDNRDGGLSGSRQHHSGPSQSQSLSAYTPTHHIGYYSNSYTSGPPLFSSQSSLSLSSSHLAADSQVPRFNHPVSQAPPTMPFMKQTASNSVSLTASGATLHDNSSSSSSDYVQDVKTAVSSAKSTSTLVTVKEDSVSGASGGEVLDSCAVSKDAPQKLWNPAKEPGVRNDLGVKADSSLLQSTIPASVAAETLILGASSNVLILSPRESESVQTDVDSIKAETITKSISVGDIQKQPVKKGHLEILHQVSGHAGSTVCQDSGESSKGVASESAEAKIAPSLSGLRNGVLEAVHTSLTFTGEVQSDVPGVDLSTKSSSLSSDVAKDHDGPLQEKFARESVVTKEVEGTPVGVIYVDHSFKADESLKQTDHDGKFETSDRVTVVMETSQREVEYPTTCIGVDRMGTYGSSNIPHGGSISNSNSSFGMTDSLSSKDSENSKSNMSENEATSVSANFSDADLENERDAVGNTRPRSSSGIVSGSNKTSVEANKTKNRGKKKMKEMLQKADALGTTSDLYMAYKGPEEKKENIVVPEVTSENNSKDVSADAKTQESNRNNEVSQSKHELDDWEDAADISATNLQSTGKAACGGSLDEDGLTEKKYSRDFLLTFAEQCMNLPDGFEITSDIEALLRANVHAACGDHEYPSSARIVVRPSTTARDDWPGNGTMDVDRWSKIPGPYHSGRDPGLDLAYGSNVMGFHSGPRPNCGVLRNPRAQGAVHPAGGILSGPMHSFGFQGIQRNYSDADRWQRATNFNKGLMPAPQTPLQVMHKAEKKYEVGKISDEEQAKQRKLKGILNKLTPQNFEKLFEQVKEVKVDNALTLTGVISQIFDKALMEPTFCEMYANFCYHLASDLPELSVDNEKITFRRLLLDKCQEEFERGEREEQEANEGNGEGEIEQSEEGKEEKRLKARRRMLGNIRLIGELCKKRMLTERIMHECCIKKLLGQYQNPDEENIEALCKLMCTIGEMIDHHKAKEHMDAYFDSIGQLSSNMKLSSRVRFMLKDLIDLRKNNWQQRRKVEGPKKIEEVHRDAAQERLGQAARLSRGPIVNSAMRRGNPSEFGPRASVLSSPVGQVGGFRGMSSQVRGCGVQDVRMDERNAFESRTPSVPLPQRSSNDESITLGPQGGLARGMVSRGQPPVSSSLLHSTSSFGDPRRIGNGLNGYNTASERGMYSSRDDHFVRHNFERFGAPVSNDQSNRQELSAGHPNRDFAYPEHNVDRPWLKTASVARVDGSPTQNVSSEKVWPEERLRGMSISAIKEYYSAKDEKEVALCIKDLNAPSFYPTIVSIWVTDSFERKDLEREMLAKLLVNLTKPREGMFSQAQLIEGFESVLNNLEDNVNDAPRAPEFLGRIFGKVVIENVIPLNEVGRLIRDGGEEPGRLLEVGLAADVLGSALEMIKLEKGESALKEIRAVSNLRLEDFRPPDPIRCWKLDMFM